MELINPDTLRVTFESNGKQDMQLLSEVAEDLVGKQLKAQITSFAETLDGIRSMTLILSVERPDLVPTVKKVGSGYLH